MKMSNVVAAAALAFCAAQASAVPTVTGVTAVSGSSLSYTAFATSPTMTVSGFLTNTGSFNPNYGAAPAGGTGSFSLVTTGSVPSGTASPIGTLTFAASVSSFTFLWGSPDPTNQLFVSDSLGSQTFTGTSVFGAGANSGAPSYLVTVNFDAASVSKSITFTTGQNSFEVAQVTAVPEPETYALMLAGLGAIGWVARRRKSV